MITEPLRLVIQYRFAPGDTCELWELRDWPDVHWHRGGHITSLIAPRVRRFVLDTLSN